MVPLTCLQALEYTTYVFPCGIASFTCARGRGALLYMGACVLLRVTTIHMQTSCRLDSYGNCIFLSVHLYKLHHRFSLFLGKFIVFKSPWHVNFMYNCWLIWTISIWLTFSLGVCSTYKGWWLPDLLFYHASSLKYNVVFYLLYTSFVSLIRLSYRIT